MRFPMVGASYGPVEAANVQVNSHAVAGLEIILENGL
jgi:hypothetical protein